MREQQSPFVVGVLADFSGAPATPLARLKDRRFVTVNQQSFAQYLSHKKPRLTLALGSGAAPSDTNTVELTFETFEDFLPDIMASRLQSRGAIEQNKAQALPDLASHSESFRALHSTWAGLKYLVDSVAKTPNVKVKALDVSKRDILRDLQRAAESDQSVLFKRLFYEGIGTFGGEAFGCLIGDY